MLKLIEELSNAYGISGYEDEITNIVKKYAGDLEVTTDKLFNTYLKNNKKDPNKITIMLDGHLDEVGFMVQFIDEKGLIKFIPIGGWVVENIPAQLVVIKNSQGEYIKGVVSSKPPHFMSEEERKKKLTIEDLSIDVGANSREEVINDFKIEVGNPITPFVNFEYNERNGTMLGKAFDNRLGTACVIEAMKKLSKEDLDVNLVGALAVQEEVGLRGAKVTAQTVKPDLAIIIEGSPGDDNFSEEYKIQSGLNRGPQLRYRDNSYITSYKFVDFARKIAEKNNIPYQTAVRTSGGTNAGNIHLVEQGIPCLIVGIPVRYVHTHHCYANINDYKNALKLVCEVVRNISGATIENW
ncbi:MAG: M20/M25/M40 family metallo-hydrolase [Miniphocaeibacter sp.]|uniref:M42 family metallopeptidase n=1 Tax=Miniphocaeibacter sp. TaxID=3100973 RepID=UPI00185DA1B0|nr:M42 family metallopeptidase [Gallicola sp.]